MNMRFQDHTRFIVSTVFEKRKSLIIYSLPMIGFAFLIFAMSSLPGHSIPNLFILSYDKIVHGLEFGLLGILLYRSFFFHLRVKRPYLFTIIAGSTYAVLDEVHQYFVVGRDCSLYDFAADFLGLVIFTALSVYFHRNSRLQITYTK